MRSVVLDCLGGRNRWGIARAFPQGVANGLYRAAKALCEEFQVDTVVLSGGVFQNEMLMGDLRDLFLGGVLHIWTNHAVPPHDGGISLGQAAIAGLTSSRDTGAEHPNWARENLDDRCVA